MSDGPTPIGTDRMRDYEEQQDLGAELMAAWERAGEFFADPDRDEQLSIFDQPETHGPAAAP